MTFDPEGGVALAAVAEKRERIEAFVGVSLEPSLRREFFALAARNRRSVAAEARAAFRRHLAEQGSGVREARAA